MINSFSVPDDPSQAPCLLYVCLKSGQNIPTGPMSEQRASDHIRTWYNCRTLVGYEQGPDKVKAGKWLQDGTMALNWHYKEVKGIDIAQAAYAVSEIVAMYVIPIPRGTIKADQILTESEEWADENREDES